MLKCIIHVTMLKEVVGALKFYEFYVNACLEVDGHNLLPGVF